jgi:hypothetical protein
MKMRVQVQCAAETLHESDCAGPPAADAKPARAQAVSGEDAAQDQIQGPGDQGRITGEQEASPAREREHPLAHRHLRQDTIEQVRGGPLDPAGRA